MGVIENGKQELESHGMENLKPSENLSQNPSSDPLTSDNYKSNLGCVVTEAQVTGAQNVEKKEVSLDESSARIQEVGVISANICPSPGGETAEQQLIDVTKAPVLENAEVSLQNGIKSSENAGIFSSSALLNPGELEPMQRDGDNALGNLMSRNEETPEQTRRRKSNLKSSVESSYVLRSKSQEKSKAPEPVDTVKEGSTDGGKKKRGRKKKQRKNDATVNEFSRTRTHLRYLLHRIKYEQNLIDAYSAEGWKGQSLEKLKPEKELQRAKAHILRYKLKIRELFHRLDLSLAVGKLPESLFDAKGEIDSEDIFCAKCGSKDVPLGNDIILCDGACERGFHQFCLEPPLLKEDIPPGDEGWLCPGCDCKLDCINVLKDHQGTAIFLVDSWEKIFPEAAAAASGKQLDDGSGSLSDDSEDDDYDPHKTDASQKVDEEELGSDESDYFSASEAASPKNEKYLGLPSDESEDDDFDPMAPDPEKQVKQDSSSSDFTSDSEDLGALLDDSTEPSEVPSGISPSSYHKQPHTGSNEKNSKVGRKKRQSIKDELSSLMENDDGPVSGKRRVERLDYKKLNDETYGNSSSDSSDEDFVDIAAPKRRKGNLKKTSPNADKMETSNAKEEECQNLLKRTTNDDADGGSNESVTKVRSASTGTKRAHKRLGEAVTQRLYQSFNINQYPERAEKEKLANELGVTIQQVTKWFENARWSFNHRPRMESSVTEKPPAPEPTIGAQNIPSNLNMELQKSVAVPGPNHIAEVRPENVETNTSVETSGTQNLRKREDEMAQGQDDPTPTVVNQEYSAPGDLQSPQLRNSRRRTRSNNTVA